MRTILRRVPRETDIKLQNQMMENWYAAIVEDYSRKTSSHSRKIRKLKPIPNRAKHYSRKGRQLSKAKQRARPVDRDRGWLLSLIEKVKTNR